MCTKKIIILIILTVLIPTLSFTEEINFGGETGWEEIRTMNSRLIDKGVTAVLQLADSEYGITSSTEMLFHFNNSLYDSRGLYSVKYPHNIRISNSVSRKGSGSAVFTGEGSLELIPADTAAFAAGSGRLNDFSIEFWLNPARLSEGENIIQWSGATAVGEQTLQQEILCVVSGRNIVWELRNLFQTSTLDPTVFSLRSTRSLIPKRWHHHMLRYDNATGLIEYLIDGVPEDIIYTSRGGSEEPEIYSPYIGAAKPARFIVGRGYTGFIDELRITGAFSEPDLNKYSLNSGSAVTGIIDLDYYDSRFYSLSADSRTEGNTQIYYYYRIDNEYFLPDSDYPRWNQFSADELLPPDVKGKYLQIMTELYPDGTGATTPVLSGMTVKYEKNLPPLPPAYLTVRAGDSAAYLSWKPVTDADISGYRVYYGDKPGMYFGTDSITGKSPIDAGNELSIKIDGLQNGKLYYFAVTSYDNAETPHESIFSREINSRPSALIKEN